MTKQHKNVIIIKKRNGESTMIKSIMFVCHGNICRSPMAEFIMKKIVSEELPQADILIASAATSTEEIGNPVYPPAKAELNRHGISCDGKTAVRLRPDDYDKYDIFLVMDENNIRNIMRIFPADPQHKIHKLSEFSGSGADISDPWYTRDFGTAYNDILKGCKAFALTLSARQS